MTQWEAVAILIASATGALVFLRLVADAVSVTETSLTSFERREEKLLQQRINAAASIQADRKEDAPSPGADSTEPA